MQALEPMEEAMTAYFEEHRSEAGTGLELLPGVARLLQALKVRRTCGWHSMSNLPADKTNVMHSSARMYDPIVVRQANVPVPCPAQHCTVCSVAILALVCRLYM